MLLLLMLLLLLLLLMLLLLLLVLLHGLHLGHLGSVTRLLCLCLRGSEVDRLSYGLSLRLSLSLSLGLYHVVELRLLPHSTRLRILALSLCHQVFVQRRVHVCSLSHAHICLRGWSEALHLLRECRTGLRNLRLRLRLGLPLLRLLHSRLCGRTR